MRIGFIGDTHGNWNDLYRAIDRVAEAGAEKIVQVGDFGYWDFALPTLKLEVPVHFIDGNHEQFPLLLDKISPSRLTPQEIQENLFYIPRGTILNWGGTVFGFLGGGFSVDNKFRKDGFDWFSIEERPKDSEALPIIKHKPDFMVTHDAPSEAVFYMGITLQHKSEEDDNSRAVLQKVLDGAKPKFWVHGHYHGQYSARVGDCKIVGLACAPDAIVFDTEKNLFGI